MWKARLTFFIGAKGVQGLRSKAEDLWNTIINLETEKYDLEERSKRQDYDVSISKRNQLPMLQYRSKDLSYSKIRSSPTEDLFEDQCCREFCNKLAAVFKTYEWGRLTTMKTKKITGKILKPPPSLSLLLSGPTSCVVERIARKAEAAEQAKSPQAWIGSRVSWTLSTCSLVAPLPFHVVVDWICLPPPPGPERCRVERTVAGTARHYFSSSTSWRFVERNESVDSGPTLCWCWCFFGLILCFVFFVSPFVVVPCARAVPRRSSKNSRKGRSSSLGIRLWKRDWTRSKLSSTHKHNLGFFFFFFEITHASSPSHRITTGWRLVFFPSRIATNQCRPTKALTW